MHSITTTDAGGVRPAFSCLSVLAAAEPSWATTRAPWVLLGRVDTVTGVCVARDRFTPQQARTLAAQLLAAAAEVEGVDR